MSHLPAHVQASIETRLGLPLGLATGYTKPGWCPKCGRAILAGYDAPACAGLAVVDPYGLIPQLEAAAIILRVPTYELHGNLRRMLSARTHPDVPPIVEYDPANKTVVVAQHRCGQSLGGKPITTTNTVHAQFPDHPPF